MAESTPPGARIPKHNTKLWEISTGLYLYRRGAYRGTHAG